MPGTPWLAAIFSGSAFFAFIIVFLLVKISVLSHSLKTATGAARGVASGNMETKLSSTDEELSHAFNTMVSSLKLRLDELLVRQDELSTTLETMADGVIVIDEDEQILLVNRAAENLLGLYDNRPLKSHFIEVIRDYELQQLVDNARRSGRQEHKEIELFNPRRFLSAIATPLQRDRSSGVLLTLHDLTTMRQVETTRKEFVSNVSHELRNPLASIKAMVETLEDGAINERNASMDFLNRIHKEVDRMTALVSDLLELSRLESGQSAIDIRPMDMRPLIDDVVAIFQEQAITKGISLYSEYGNVIPIVMGNEEKLREVLINLVENAIKFTNRGEIRVSTNVNGNEVAISVRDTGEGIAEDHLPHIFERFYKVERSRSDGGTGLGLAIAKHIVQLHNGEISVQSREGQGSTFTFTIPSASQSLI